MKQLVGAAFLILLGCNETSQTVTGDVPDADSDDAQSGWWPETDGAPADDADAGLSDDGNEQCSPETDKLDVLFMVDNSNSMAEEQTALAAQIPYLVRAISTGDLDQDGTPELGHAPNVHFGAISSDMGAGGNRVPSCDTNPNFGDDGILNTHGNVALADCQLTYPSFLEFQPGNDPTAAESFAHDFTCVAQMGTGGCGFEQQLEATLKALTPSTCTDSWCEFRGGTRGRATDDNSGFLRPDSVLVVVELTDENDCSSIQDELYNGLSTQYTGDLNLRCFRYPNALRSVQRYIEGLAATRTNPNRLVYTLIAGVPMDTQVSNLAGYNELLAREDMVEREDPGAPVNRPLLVPSCETAAGRAFPATRLVEVGKGLQQRGARTLVESICQSDYRPIATHLLKRIGDALAGRCQ